RHKTHGRGLGPGNVAVFPRRQVGLAHPIGRGEDFGGVAIVIAGQEGPFVSLVKDLSILEAALKETYSGFRLPVIEPVEEPQSPEVLTALNLARRHLESFEGF